MSQAIPKWTEERTETLKSIVGSESPVSVATVKTAAETLETTTRSIASKLRKEDFEVESTASATKKAFTDAEEAEITDFLDANDGVYTYAEVAANVLGGSRTAKQIQGKILSMEQTGSVKETPKVERVKAYSDAEEVKILELVRSGAFIEDVAEAMGRPVPSVRGKILSLGRVHKDIKIPKQKTYKTKEVADPIAALGDVTEMTVESIAEAIDKTVRGVKAMLTYRALTCANYDGAKKAAKNAEAKA